MEKPFKNLTQNQLKVNLIKIQNPAGSADWIKHSVVDDGVHGEGHAVRGENLLRRDLKHSGPGVNPANLEKNKSRILSANYARRIIFSHKILFSRLIYV